MLGSSVTDEMTAFVGETRILPPRAGMPFKVWTLEGWMTVNEGDYVIKDTFGDVYPCRPHIFEHTYERAE